MKMCVVGVKMCAGGYRRLVGVRSMNRALDGIYAERLKLGSRLLFTLLGHCLTSFFVHGFLPKNMIDNVLVPVIKSKTMNIGLSKYESTSATCAIANTQCCQSIIQNLVYKFVCRLDKSNNTIVKALLSSSIVYSSRIRSHWRGLLYVHGVYE